VKGKGEKRLRREVGETPQRFRELTGEERYFEASRNKFKRSNPRSAYQAIKNVINCKR
jgi:hypothetical protein